MASETQTNDFTTAKKTAGASKVWLVTGASRGFGRAWTEDILARGDRVAATVRDRRVLDDLLARYGEQRLLVLPLDVTDRERVFAAVRQTHEHFGGRLDVVLHNAGVSLNGAIEEAKVEEVRGNFETNFFGALHVIQASIPFLRAQGSGHVLVVSSISGLVPFPLLGVYSATKHAIEAICEALAAEVAQLGIRVTAIEPGPYKTDFGHGPVTKHEHKEYDAMFEAMAKGVAGGYGEVHATSPALFQLVDDQSAAAPLRLILGSTCVPLVRHKYAERLDSIARWEPVSIASQGVSS